MTYNFQDHIGGEPFRDTLIQTLNEIDAKRTRKWGTYNVNGIQTSNLTAGNHVQLSIAEGSLGGLSVGSGQENGIITLPYGKTYKIHFETMVTFSSASGSMSLAIYDYVNDTSLSDVMYQLPLSSTTQLNASNSYISTIFAPKNDTENKIVVKIQGSNLATGINPFYTRLVIEEFPV